MRLRGIEKVKKEAAVCATWTGKRVSPATGMYDARRFVVSSPFPGRYLGVSGERERKW